MKRNKGYTMDAKKGLLASLVLNMMLLFLVFYVKHNVTAQAQEAVKKKQEAANEMVRQAGEIFVNNNVLWDLVINIQKSPDKSVAGITKLAKAARLPNRKDEAAFLVFQPTSVGGKKARLIGWDKYNFTVVFDDKDNMADINVDDLLGKTSTAGGAVAEEGSADEAAPAAEEAPAKAAPAKKK